MLECLRLNKKPEWVAECLQNWTLVCLTDGSYIKNSAPDLCSAGWVLACRRTCRYIAGTLVERSPWANSFRGELLGMLAIMLFLLAVEEYHEVVSSGTQAYCNCKGVITTFEKKEKRVATCKKKGNILRALQAVRLRTKSYYKHRRVKGHQVITSRSSFEATLNDYYDE